MMITTLQAKASDDPHVPKAKGDDMLPAKASDDTHVPKAEAIDDMLQTEDTIYPSSQNFGEFECNPGRTLGAQHDMLAAKDSIGHL